MNVLSIEKEEPLITFGQLLKIKREQMNLSQNDIQKRLKIGAGNLSNYENGYSYPQKSNMQRLTSFYKLTEDEISNCKKITKKSRYKERMQPNLVIKVNKKSIVNLISDLKEILESVCAMDESGIFAKKLKTDLRENLRQAHELLNDVLIIDRLI